MCVCVVECLKLENIGLSLVSTELPVHLLGADMCYSSNTSCGSLGKSMVLT